MAWKSGYNFCQFRCVVSSRKNLKIDHIGIAVNSIDRALEFYRDVLGVEPSDRFLAKREQIEAALLPLGESRLELLESSSEDSVIARFIDKRGEGLHHVAIRVPDLEVAIKRICTAGIHLVTDEIQTSPGGYRYIFVHPRSVTGVLLELVEYPEDGKVEVID